MVAAVEALQRLVYATASAVISALFSTTTGEPLLRLFRGFGRGGDANAQLLQLGQQHFFDSGPVLLKKSGGFSGRGLGMCRGLAMVARLWRPSKYFMKFVAFL